MSLIFDHFATRESAETFVSAVKERFGLEGQVFETNDSAQEHDPFPGVLVPLIVHIDRSGHDEIEAALAEENAVRALGEEMGGVFVGT